MTSQESAIGKVESVWRYPVKSMRGEELKEMFAGYAGVYGDRLYAVRSSASRPGFPFLTARDQRKMLCYRPRFCAPEKSIAPPNLAAAEKLPPGTTPIYATPEELRLEVVTPGGKALAVEDPALLELLAEGIDPKHQLTLQRSERALTDCRPLSLFSLQTVAQLAEESGGPVDKRCFRANLYLDLAPAEGFAEERLIGRTLRIGSQVVVSILELDPRCMLITLDPETGEKTPAILKSVAQEHAGLAGLYAAVLVQGMVRPGDSVALLA